MTEGKEEMMEVEEEEGRKNHQIHNKKTFF